MAVPGWRPDPLGRKCGNSRSGPRWTRCGKRLWDGAPATGHPAGQQKPRPFLPRSVHIPQPDLEYYRRVCQFTAGDPWFAAFPFRFRTRLSVPVSLDTEGSHDHQTI